MIFITVLQNCFYGTTLCPPAELFHRSGRNPIHQVSYVTRLKETMTQPQATLIYYHRKQTHFVSINLSHCTHVFVQQDVIRRTLEQSYHSLHMVIKCGAKTFTVDVNGKQEAISLDSLKPAHIEDSVTMDVTQ